ncbi:MAG: anti-sigma factor [Rhizobiaceae bacterium]|nr:anti-sigma factor [Rhizobiaceae bacterium]MCV0404723.1 anti-sigma factor [Rhizobiaceae bacterium]
MATRFDDETLMAFADGELDEATAAAVEEAIGDDDTLMARVEMFMETRARARAELKPTSEEPVPAALEAAVREMVESSRKASVAAADSPTGRVLPIDAARRKRGLLQAGTWQLPLAASLATAIAAGVIGYQLGSGNGPFAPRLVNASRTDIEEALRTLESGQERRLPGDGRIRIVASFRDNNETLCREYEVDPVSGNSLVAVSCREGDSWETRFAVAAPAGAEGYAPASSMDALEAYLSAIEAGPPLSEEEEAEALAGVR